MGAGGNKKFGEYLSHIGLGAKVEEKKLSKEQIIAKSRGILDKARQMLRKKHGSI